MKGKAIIPLALGLGIGIVTVKLAVDTIRKARAADKSTMTIKAVRARQDIGAHQEITVEMVELVETADSLFAPAKERIEAVEDVVGRVAAKAIPEHSAVLHSMLAPKGTRPGMVGRIPPGYRAVSVKIDEVTGVAYQLQSGDWVDVIVVIDIAAPIQGFNRGRKETIAEVILQHVQVVAIGRATDNEPGGSSRKAKPAKSATLLVREKDVPKLHLAGTRGRITLAMRGDDDKTMAIAPRANMSDVLAMMRGAGAAGEMSNARPQAELNPNAPQRLTKPEPAQPHVVLVMRGTSGRVSQEFERITFQAADSSRIIDIKAGPPTRAATTLGVVAPSSYSDHHTGRTDSVQGRLQPTDGE